MSILRAVFLLFFCQAVSPSLPSVERDNTVPALGEKIIARSNL